MEKSSRCRKGRRQSRLDNEQAASWNVRESFREDLGELVTTPLGRAELFPKQSDLRFQAVRLLMRLEESGPRKQTELVEELGMEDYAMSRLLRKLELHRYLVRRREETDKLVSLQRTWELGGRDDLIILEYLGILDDLGDYPCEEPAR
jgi:hypothetical protein